MELASKTNILLVDDRQENLISLAAILDSTQYNLVMATSGQQALRHILEEEFALILMDVQMPLMDGFETASVIKKREKSKSIPIIFISALSPEEPFLFRGYSAGAVDYIVKPFDPTVLRSKVAVFAELYQKNKQLELQSKILQNHERLEKEQAIAKIELNSLRREQAINEKYKDLVDGIKDGVVWTADLSTSRFSFISAQVNRLLGIAAFEKAILECTEFKKFKKAAIQNIKKNIPFERDCSFEHLVESLGAPPLWLQTSIRIADTEEAEKYELRGLSVDITQIKKAQQEAQAAINIRDQFLSIASHELKTPLTPLCLQIGILQKMTREGASNEAIRQKISMVLDRFSRQTDRLNHLIDELLDISRINNGKLVLEKEETCLNVTVREVTERLAVEANRAGSTIAIDTPGNITGHWDRLRLEQVITNLLVNAIKYGDGKPVEISTELQGRNAILRVKDNGIGIRAEDQNRIFQLYERAVSPMHFGGLGLGLFIVSQIVDAHNGQISVESKLGEGSTFTVKFPLQVDSKISDNTKAIQQKSATIESHSVF